jgi:outer membrane murein-binding lipoprotein Lpp
MNKLIKASVLAIAIAFTAGCAQTSDMQAAIDDLAVRVAVLESDVADVAVAADAAGRAAEQSQDCCDATNEKIDRMFQQSQSK